VKRFALVAALVIPGTALAQQSSIPDAIIGKAPPPSGQTAKYLPGDTLTRGYLAVPAGKGPFPALIMIHEWDGVNDRDRQVADMFAAHGYVTLLADLYQGKTGSNQQENVALMNDARAHLDRVVGNLDGAQKFLRARPDVSGKVGVMGWCFGGGIALSYALGGAEHQATAIFYGRLVNDPAQLARIHHPIYGTFAGQDKSITPAMVARFRTVLDSLGITNDIHVYDPVQHGFWLWVDRDAATNTAPATDAWQRLVKYLHDNLGGGN